MKNKACKKPTAVKLCIDSYMSQGLLSSLGRAPERVEVGISSLCSLAEGGSWVSKAGPCRNPMDSRTSYHLIAIVASMRWRLELVGSPQWSSFVRILVWVKASLCVHLREWFGLSVRWIIRDPGPFGHSISLHFVLLSLRVERVSTGGVILKWWPFDLAPSARVRCLKQTRLVLCSLLDASLYLASRLFSLWCESRLFLLVYSYLS